MPPLRSLVAVLCLAAAGCSLLLDTAEPVQCATDADCDASPALRNRVCRQGFCVNPELDPGFTADAGEGCVSTTLCTQGNSNQPSVCRRAGGECTPIATEQCKDVEGAWDDPNAIFIGDIQPFTTRQVDGASSPPSPYADRVRRAINLAVDEFDTQAPGGFVFFDGRRRPLAVVHCDSGFVSESARSAFRHLTEAVGAQAVILGADKDLAAIAADATAKQVAIACSDCVGPLPEGPLAWRIIPRLELEAPMAAWRVSKLEEQIKSGPNPPAAIKVAVLLSPGRATEAFVNALTDTLQFNGKKAQDNVTTFTIVRTEDPTTASVNHDKHASTIAAFAPDVVVVAMGPDFTTYYLRNIEGKWPAGKRRPHYVTTDLNFSLEPFAAAITSDDVRRRISGTRPGFDANLQKNIDAFTARYLIANDYKQPDFAHSGYDAFYATALAVLASRVGAVVDGPHIAASFERLRGGADLVDFRPENINYAVSLLGQPTTKIDVRGLWSNLDWKLPSRDMDVDVSMYCLQLDADGNLFINPNAGPHLRISTGLVEGEYLCD